MELVFAWPAGHPHPRHASDELPMRKLIITSKSQSTLSIKLQPAFCPQFNASMYTHIPGEWKGYDVSYQKDGKLLEAESCILGSFGPRLPATKYLLPSPDICEWSQQPASIFLVP